MKLSIILPCRNEEKTLAICITKIRKAMSKLREKDYEIIVSDSSTDSSPKIAKKMGVKLLKHNKEGYGAAYIEAFKIAKGDIIIMGDADNTYDFTEIPNLLKYIGKYDLILGKRKISRESRMPFLHRYIGNPVLSGTLSFLFKKKIQDVHTGFRIIKRGSLNKLKLKAAGMEFASEMIIKAIKNKLKIKEVSISYSGRLGESKLKPFSDGWKHLRFILLYSPMFIFLTPGIIFFIFGIASLFFLYFNTPQLLGITLYFHPMFISSLLTIAGYQLIIFSIFAKTYAITHLGEESVLFDKFYRLATLERASILGILFLIVGLSIVTIIFINWLQSNFHGIDKVKPFIMASTLAIMGIQTISSAFMLSILGIKED